MDDDDEEEDDEEDVLVVNQRKTNGLPHAEDAGGDAGHQTPQLDRLVLLHDDITNTDDDDDGSDCEEVVLLKKGDQQQPQVVSHIANVKATTSTAASPLKNASHIRHPHDEADDICLVPEIDFEGMSTDAGSDNRESQPLLGSTSHGSRISDLLGGLGRGHDHVAPVSNTFGGECAAQSAEKRGGKVSEVVQVAICGASISEFSPIHFAFILHTNLIR